MCGRVKPKCMANLSLIFEQLHASLVDVIAVCRTRPDSQAVHSLRAATRRIEVLLQEVMNDHPRAPRVQETLHKALDELKKVRKAAGPARDMDVQRMLLAEIIEASRHLVSVERGEELFPGYEKFDHYLLQRRKMESNKFVHTLKEVKPALERALGHIPDALAAGHTISQLKMVTSLASRSSLKLNDARAESLHSYRKRIREMRYLVEMHKAPPEAKRLAMRLKRILDDIGRWHDLMLMRIEAKSILGKRNLMTQAISAERDRALGIAIHAAGTFK